ncbi:MAG: prepilin-type N-terminal cleavage/methylation domain-containing protein, partial [Ruthenibacterium sp.]
MKQKRNSKKGISLVELVCAMVVLTLAVTFGLQLYFVGTKATANSARLDTASEAIVHSFETGDSSKLADMPGWTPPAPQDNT